MLSGLILLFNIGTLLYFILAFVLGITAFQGYLNKDQETLHSAVDLGLLCAIIGTSGVAGIYILKIIQLL